MGLRIKSGRSTKERRRSKLKGDRELLTLLIIYLIVILWILNFNI